MIHARCLGHMACNVLADRLSCDPCTVRRYRGSLSENDTSKIGVSVGLSFLALKHHLASHGGNFDICIQILELIERKANHPIIAHGPGQQLILSGLEVGLYPKISVRLTSVGVSPDAQEDDVIFTRLILNLAVIVVEKFARAERLYRIPNMK